MPTKISIFMSNRKIPSKNKEKSHNEISQLVIFILMLIYIICYAEFESAKHKFWKIIKTNLLFFSWNSQFFALMEPTLCASVTAHQIHFWSSLLCDKIFQGTCYSEKLRVTTHATEIMLKIDFSMDQVTYFCDRNFADICADTGFTLQAAAIWATCSNYCAPRNTPHIFSEPRVTTRNIFRNFQSVRNMDPALCASVTAQHIYFWSYRLCEKMF